MRVRRSLLNFGTSALFMIVTMIVALKSTPWLVYWLGEKPYGGYRVVFDGHGYLTLLELGLGGALGPLLARALGTGDEQRLRETAAAGARTYVLISLVSLVVGLALTPVIPWFATDLLGKDRVDLRTAWVVGLGSFLSLGLLPLRSIVEARQLGYVVNLLLTAQSLVITGLALALAWGGWGITGQALAQVVGTWAFSLVLAVVVFRSHRGLWRAILTVPVGSETRRALWSLSLPTLLLNVSGRVSLLTDNLVVGRILGTARVTSLFNTQRLAAMGGGVLQSVGGASWAALAELHAQGDRETFNRRLIEISRLVALLAAAGLAPVVAFNAAFFRIWLANTVAYGGDLVIATAAINTLLLGEVSLWAWCFTATGNIRRVVGPLCLGAMVNLTVSVILTQRIGVAGPLIGTTVGFTAIGLWVLPWLLERTFGTPVGPLARAVALPVAWGVVATFMLRALAAIFEPGGWGSLIAVMGLSALVILTAGAAVLLPPAERALWRGRLRALWNG